MTLPRFFSLLRRQSGAMFGMDARVALIIASVLAATGGVTLMSQLDRSKVENAERGVDVIKNALASHYRAHGLSDLAPDLQTLFDTGYMEETSLKQDSWNADWVYNKVTRQIELEDVPVIVHLATIHSRGKDGVNDSNNILTPADWDTWTPDNDDIGTKFSTIEIEKQRVEEYRERGKLIIDKLSERSTANYLEADAICNSGNPEDWCSDAAGSGRNYTQINYYPQSNLDDTGATYYGDSSIAQHEVFVSGDPESMRTLMDFISLPRAFATDPWGRVMNYTSNVNEKTEPPFTASIWFE